MMEEIDFNDITFTKSKKNSHCSKCGSAEHTVPMCPVEVLSILFQCALQTLVPIVNKWDMYLRHVQLKKKKKKKKKENVFVRSFQSRHSTSSRSRFFRIH